MRTLILTGKEDTAQFYMEVFKKKYPKLSFESFPQLESDETDLMGNADDEKNKSEKESKEKNKILKAVEGLKKTFTDSNKRTEKDHFSVQIRC